MPRVRGLLVLLSLAALGVAAVGSLGDVLTEVPRVVRLLPYGTVLVALVVPLAAGIYLLTITACGTGERALPRRGDGQPRRR